MEFYNSTTNLKDLLGKTLTAKATDSEILAFIQYAGIDAVYGDNFEHDLLILEIYTVLKNFNTNFIPLIDFSLNAIPEKIILTNSAVKKENKSSDLAETQNVHCDNKVNESEDDEYEALKAAFIKHYSPFRKEDNPELIYPNPGDIGNVIIEDTSLSPGRVFIADVKIDSEGNILGFLKEPTELIQNTDYDSIYSGLIGQLFQFQQNEK